MKNITLSKVVSLVVVSAFLMTSSSFAAAKGVRSIGTGGPKLIETK